MTIECDLYEVILGAEVYTIETITEAIEKVKGSIASTEKAEENAKKTQANAQTNFDKNKPIIENLKKNTDKAGNLTNPKPTAGDLGLTTGQFKELNEFLLKPGKTVLDFAKQKIAGIRENAGNYHTFNDYDKILEYLSKRVVDSTKEVNKKTNLKKELDYRLNKLNEYKKELEDFVNKHIPFNNPFKMSHTLTQQKLQNILNLNKLMKVGNPTMMKYDFKYNPDHGNFLYIVQPVTHNDISFGGDPHILLGQIKRPNQLDTYDKDAFDLVNDIVVEQLTALKPGYKIENESLSLVIGDKIIVRAERVNP